MSNDRRLTTDERLAATSKVPKPKDTSPLAYAFYLADCNEALIVAQDAKTYNALTLDGGACDARGCLDGRVVRAERIGPTDFEQYEDACDDCHGTGRKPRLTVWDVAAVEQLWRELDDHRMNECQDCDDGPCMKRASLWGKAREASVKLQAALAQRKEGGPRG